MNNIPVPPQFLQMLKGGNPQQMLTNILQNNSKGNPLVENVLSMVQGNNTAGIEQIARNLCKSRGINADEMYQQISNMMK